jgi:triphosphoribosyl-dephospho-CoA synthase
MITTIADAAAESLIQEVLTTPKPGLVDTLSCGAHHDMDLQLFLKSAHALTPFFHTAAKTGALWTGTLPDLFRQLRVSGVQAEQDMYAATGGVNTHKGLIFSEGILTAAAAYSWTVYGTLGSTTIFQIVQEMTNAILLREFIAAETHPPVSHGEHLYRQYGYTGIRGEVMHGFPSVCRWGLPVLTQCSAAHGEKNRARLQTLFTLMAHVDDTNILHRSNPQTLMFVKECAQSVLASGGAYTREGIQMMRELDDVFISRNISPGGCADLLAVTILLHTLGSLDYRTATASISTRASLGSLTT